MMLAIIILVIIAAYSFFETNVASSQSAATSSVNLKPLYSMLTPKQAPVEVILRNLHYKQLERRSTK